ncbi:MAG: hypothetical protein U9Q99_00845, partial [Nanoarchaeota archaeon]|nr:hypothetical protein [Nanoarchaeota archaeon]
MIKLIGTNHLMSKEAIEGIIKDEAPDIICLELCNFREDAILNQIKEETKETTLLGKITSKIKEKAEKQGMNYGSDQKTALRYAKNENLQYFLVDMPILKIQELFSKIPEKEQLGFASELKEFENESIKEVSEEEVLNQLKQRYPTAFEFLINMRNLYISKELMKVMRDNPNKRILVFLGKGHVKQIE